MSVRRRIPGTHYHMAVKKKPLLTPPPYFQRQTLSFCLALIHPPPLLCEPPTDTHTPIFWLVFIISHLLYHNPPLFLQLGTANWSRLHCDMGTWHNCWTNSEAFSFRPVLSKLYTDTNRQESLITSSAFQLANWQILLQQRNVCIFVWMYLSVSLLCPLIIKRKTDCGIRPKNNRTCDMNSHEMITLKMCI